MPTLYHPHIPDHSITVDAADVEANMKAGWRKTPPSNTPPAPKPKPKPKAKAKAKPKAQPPPNPAPPGEDSAKSE